MKIKFSGFKIQKGSVVQLKNDIINLCNNYNKIFKTWNTQFEMGTLFVNGNSDDVYVQLPTIAMETLFGKKAMFEFDAETNRYCYNIILPNHIYTEEEMHNIHSGLVEISNFKEQFVTQFYDDVYDLIEMDYMD